MSLLDLLVALLLSRILAVLLENVGIASMVAYIISGYLLSKSVLGVLNDIDTTLLNLSLITLFFYIGLNIDLRISKSVARKSLVMSSSGVLTTTALVGLTTYLITNDLITSLIAGIALSNTATEVIFLIVSSRELSNELFREVLVTSSFIDDLLVISLIATLGLIKSDVPVIPYLIKHTVFVSVVITLGYVISKLLSSKLASPRVIINTAMLMLFSTTLAAYVLGVDLAFTAYFTGFH
jgi:cell volume regulation protein A